MWKGYAWREILPPRVSEEEKFLLVARFVLCPAKNRTEDSLE
jgi:hypothetical protein